VLAGHIAACSLSPSSIALLGLERPVLGRRRSSITAPISLDILSLEHAQDRLRGDPLVQVQRHRLDLEPSRLPLPGPLQPRFVAAGSVGGEPGVGFGQ
jgi:hypothetical protein